MRKVGFGGLWFGAGAMAAVAMGAFVALRGGVSAKVEPGKVEAAIARRMLRFGIPASYKEMRNPEPHMAGAGRAHFADHCAICHANDGSGDTEMGRNLYPRVPDMRRPETQQLTDGELYYIIENGIRLTGMPGWGDGSPQSQLESWHLVAFIRHLPQLTPKEKLEMEQFNPKSLQEWIERQEDEEFLRAAEPSGAASKKPNR